MNPRVYPLNAAQQNIRMKTVSKNMAAICRNPLEHTQKNISSFSQNLIHSMFLDIFAVPAIAIAKEGPIVQWIERRFPKP